MDPLKPFYHQVAKGNAAVDLSNADASLYVTTPILKHGCTFDFLATIHRYNFARKVCAGSPVRVAPAP